MEIRVLHYFLTVVREESITKAAEVLHITQPTLSRQLSQMERELGVTLFHRGARRIALTDEGMLLPELLKSFSRRYPRVTYDIYTENADAVKEQMDKGLVDIGLLLEPIDIEKYGFIRMAVKEKWIVLMRPDDPLAKQEYVTAKDLKEVPLIFPRRTSVQNELANWFGSDYSDLQVHFTSNFSTNGAVMVFGGLGYSITLEGALPFWDRTKQAYRPLFPELTATSVLAWKRGQPFSLAANRFITFAKCFLSMDKHKI